MNDNAHFEYVGNLHIHSRFSDGAGSVSEIAQAAKKVGLDFIILNDHDYMTDGLHLDEEGFYGSELVLLGLEIGRRYNHYLACDLKEMVKGETSTAQEVIDQVNAQGGIGFLAHPFEKGMPFKEKSTAYTWNDLSVSGFTGICIWNFASRWKERVKTALHGLFFLLFKSQFLRGPSGKTIAFWDSLCKQRRVVAIGGSDAHGTLFRYGVLRFRPLSYDYLLNSINVHILLDRKLPKGFAEAKAEICGAMKEGRLFIAHERLAPARGFRFCYVSEDRGSLTMGEEGQFQNGNMHIEAPFRGEIRLLRNGILYKRWYGKSASCRIVEKGVYRVEVYRRLFIFRLRPWIFTNPIYLR